MASSTVENYLKQLYMAQLEVGAELVPMGRLSTALDVAPGTATSMVKALRDAELVTYEPRDGVRLTKHGEQLALHVLRRHRLMELFLVQELELDWSEVHEEAEELEHVVSDRVVEAMDRRLGHPQVDPHGDPIPSAAGQMSRQAMQSLGSCPLERPLRVARVANQDGQFLRFLDTQGLRPGTEVIVTRRDPVADAVTVRPASAETEVTIGSNAAAKVLVEGEADPSAPKAAGGG
jgi:DtxR family Mn-dependent transcriptional regulator